VSDAAASTGPDVRDVRSIPDGVELAIALPDTLAYFQGHFPGRPVLPGVVQIDWAVSLADRYLGTAIGAARNFQVKFRSIIPPGGTITLVLRRAAGDRRLLFEFRRGEDVLSSGSVRLEDAA